MAHCHLQSGEPSPGNSEHAYVSVRPRLMREPCNYLLSIFLLLLGVLTLWRYTFTCSETANVDAYAHVATMRKIRMLAVIFRCRAVVFAIWQILQSGRELLIRLRSIWHVERRCQPY